MDLGPLRALVRDVNFAVLGVDVTVTRPGVYLPVATRGIWLPPVVDEVPFGHELARREPRRILALPRSDVDSAPRGTVIAAPESPGSVTVTWVVDGLAEAQTPEHLRVIVRPQRTS